MLYKLPCMDGLFRVGFILEVKVVCLPCKVMMCVGMTQELPFPSNERKESGLCGQFSYIVSLKVFMILGIHGVVKALCG